MRARCTTQCALSYGPLENVALRDVDACNRTYVGLRTEHDHASRCDFALSDNIHVHTDAPKRLHTSVRRCLSKTERSYAKMSKQHGVQLGSFKRWQMPSFGYEIKECDGRQMVVKIWCKVCCKYIEKIKHDGRIRGQALKDILRLVYVIATCTAIYCSYCG